MQGAAPTIATAVHETFIVCGIAAPGIATVTGAERPYKWDVKDAKGNSGATTTYQGEGVVKCKVELHLWKDGTDPTDPTDHFAEWDSFRELLQSGMKEKKLRALDVLHPALVDVDVYAAGVERIGQLVPKGGGLWSVTFDLVEYKPPKKAGGTPSGAKGAMQPGSGGGGGADGAKNAPSAKDEQDKELEKLLAQAKAA